LVHILSETAKHLADGELLQLHNIQNQEMSEEVYFDIIRRKTAALFAACAEAGARSVNAAEKDCEVLRRYGEIVGLCFQIRDDIFDYLSGSEIGKPTGNDMGEGKITLPLIYALNVTKDAQMLHLAQLVKQGEASERDIQALVRFTVENGGINYAFERMSQLAQQAHDLLAAYPDSPVHRALNDYVLYVVARNF
jgi:octaprenyl-diphosphate synthase